MFKIFVNLRRYIGILKYKISKAGRNLIFRFPKIKEPKLYMTLLVKNEIDIIEENIFFHKKMGVDGIIVTDNGSTDGTYELLQKYLNKGVINELILDTEPSHNQDVKVDRMIAIARDKFHADWVMNVDADEFWYSKQGNIKSELAKKTQSVVKCPMVNVYPSEENVTHSTYVVNKTNFDKDKYNFPKYSLYNAQYPKVIHRTDGYKMIAMGNHDADMKKKSEVNARDIIIYHYSVRGKEHFRNKMVNGAIAALKVEGGKKNAAGHWKYFYDLLVIQGKDAADEYSRYIGRKYFDEFVDKGILKYDDTMEKYMCEMEALLTARE